MYDELKEALKGTRFEDNRSAWIRDCIQSLIDERKKMKALGQPIQDRSAIKQPGAEYNTKQVILDKVCHEWILDYTNRERRDKTLEGLELEDLRTLGISCRNTGTAIMSTLPKLEVSHKDKEPKKRLDLEKLQTTTAPDPEPDPKEGFPREEEEIIIE